MALETLLAALEASALSSLLRSSIWLYPLINIGHVVGIALLFGAIVPLDLRLIGCFSRTPLEPLTTTLIPVAVAGLVLALFTGALLFAAQPLAYGAEPLFGIKLALLCTAVLNALALRLWPRGQGVGLWVSALPLSAGRIQGLLSILLWLGVITAGRWIGYR